MSIETLIPMNLRAAVDAHEALEEPRPADPGLSKEWKKTPAWRAKALGLDESHPDVARLASTVEGFTKRCIRNQTGDGTWLVVSGPTGTGKTHCARRMRKYVASWAITAWHQGYWPKMPPAVVYIDWAALVDRKSDQPYHDALDEIRAEGCGLVILDDIGAETDPYKSGENASRLRSLLSEIENRKRIWLFVTTNIPRGTWKSAWDQRVADRLGKAVCLEIKAPSYRIKS